MCITYKVTISQITSRKLQDGKSVVIHLVSVLNLNYFSLSLYNLPTSLFHRFLIESVFFPKNCHLWGKGGGVYKNRRRLQSKCKETPFIVNNMMRLIWN